MAGPRASAATLAGAAWAASKTTDGATGASYTYSFSAATSAALDEITMTVPTGTAGTPSVGTVSPASIAGGSVSLSGTTLTYSFTSATIISNEAISVQINGITNTTTAGSDTSTITTDSSSGAIDTGTDGNGHLHGPRAYEPGLVSVVHDGRRHGHELHVHVHYDGAH